MLKKTLRILPFYYHIELAEGVGLVSKMLSHGRNAKEDAISARFDGLAIRHKLQNTNPTVAAIAATEVLGIEHHLMNILPCRVLIATISIIHLVVVAAAWLFSIIF